MPPWTQIRSEHATAVRKINTLRRHGNPDPAELARLKAEQARLRAELDATRAEDYLQRVVDRFPPFTPGQIERLRTILTGATAYGTPERSGGDGIAASG